MKRLSLFFFLLWAITSCRSSSSLGEAEKKVIIDSIRHTLNNYYNDIRTSGLNAEVNYLDNSPEFFWVPPGYAGSLSYDSVIATLKRNALNCRSVDNSFDSLRIIPLTKELATYTGVIHSIWTDTSGRSVSMHLAETGVMIKRGSGWKLLSGQTTLLDQE